MKTFLTGLLLSLLSLSCQEHTYEIDLSHAKDFDWDGKLRVTKVQRSEFVPIPMVVSRTEVERIQLVSKDGSSVDVDMNGYQGAPVASMGLGAPDKFQILGTQTLWHGPRVVLIADPQDVAGYMKDRALPPFAGEEEQIQARNFAREGVRPYQEHVEELSLADWWAIAQNEATGVVVTYAIPQEGLIVTMSGNPREYGPAELEVRNANGDVLKRFERKQIKLAELQSKPQ